jgi:hypothetical protein
VQVARAHSSRRRPPARDRHTMGARQHSAWARRPSPPFWPPPHPNCTGSLFHLTLPTFPPCLGRLIIDKARALQLCSAAFVEPEELEAEDMQPMDWCNPPMPLRAWWYQSRVAVTADALSSADVLAHLSAARITFGDRMLRAPQAAPRVCSPQCWTL